MYELIYSQIDSVIKNDFLKALGWSGAFLEGLNINKRHTFQNFIWKTFGKTFIVALPLHNFAQLCFGLQCKILIRHTAVCFVEVTVFIVKYISQIILIP